MHLVQILLQVGQDVILRGRLAPAAPATQWILDAPPVSHRLSGATMQTLVPVDTAGGRRVVSIRPIPSVTAGGLFRRGRATH